MNIFYGLASWALKLFSYECHRILFQVMDWCHQATSHYISQCWLRSMSTYGINRLQYIQPPDTLSTLVQAINFCLFSEKSLLGPMLNYILGTIISFDIWYQMWISLFRQIQLNCLLQNTAYSVWHPWCWSVHDLFIGRLFALCHRAFERLTPPLDQYLRQAAY